MRPEGQTNPLQHLRRVQLRGDGLRGGQGAGNASAGERNDVAVAVQSRESADQCIGDPRVVFQGVILIESRLAGGRSHVTYAGAFHRKILLPR